MASSTSNTGSRSRSPAPPHTHLQEKISFPVLCCHGVQAKFGAVTKNNENCGRLYYGCPYYPKEGCCSFFLWEDDVLKAAYHNRDVGDDDIGNSESCEKSKKIQKLKKKNKELKEQNLRAVLTNEKKNMYLKCTLLCLMFVLLFYNSN